MDDNHSTAGVASPTEGIRFIRAGQEQAVDVLRLLKGAAQWMVSSGIKQWTPEQFTEQDIAGYFVDRQVYLAVDGTEAVGMFTLQFSDLQYWGDLNDESYAYLHRLAVDVTRRGQGLGEAMLQFAVRQARELGCKALRFDTVAHNVKLNRYYQGLGFHYMGTRDMGAGRLVNLYEHFKQAPGHTEMLLRYTSPADFEQLKRWSPSAEYLKQWAGPSFRYPLDEEQLKHYIEGSNHPAESESLIYSAIHSATGKVIGHISLSAIDRENHSARISRVLVDPEFQGRGAGTAMVKEVLRISFDALRLHRVSLGVFEFNTAALKIYEACGFRREGNKRESALFNGQYVDCIELSLLDREWRATASDFTDIG